MIFLILLLLFVIFVIGLFLVDYFRRTPNAKKIPLTFIVPCYNDADTVAETIDAIYAAYPLEFITLLVINDASSDNSHEVIVTKQNQYGFVYHQNLTNQGKVKTINNAIDQVQTEYFMIVDADTCVSGSAIDDML
jgi:biofilm PGA synthesis N-glycosyltransferase PgaC